MSSGSNDIGLFEAALLVKAAWDAVPVKLASARMSASHARLAHRLHLQLYHVNWVCVLMLVFLDRGNASSMIIKSPTDPRVYSSVELPNNLRVLLVSHPKTERATAAASMGSGSFNEGWETRGLAHFCEHMLFLGNAKYPIEGDYSKYCHRVWVV